MASAAVIQNLPQQVISQAGPSGLIQQAPITTTNSVFVPAANSKLDLAQPSIVQASQTLPGGLTQTSGPIAQGPLQTALNTGAPLQTALPIGTPAGGMVSGASMPKSVFQSGIASNYGGQLQPVAAADSNMRFKDKWLSLYRRSLWFKVGYSLALWLLTIVLAGFFDNYASLWTSFVTSALVFIYSIRMIVAINKRRAPKVWEGIVYKFLVTGLNIANIILLAIDTRQDETERDFGYHGAHAIFSALLILFGIMLIAQLYTFVLTIALAFRLRRLEKQGYAQSGRM